MVLAAGFIWTCYLMSQNQILISNAAWFFWSASFLFLPLLAFANLAEYFVSYWPSVKFQLNGTESQSSRSNVGHPAKFLIMTIMAVVFCALFHVFGGFFLSVMNPVEPLDLFSINGFNQNFSAQTILYHFEKLSLLLPSFIILKLSSAFVEQSVRIKGFGMLRDALVPLFAGAFSFYVLKNQSTIIQGIAFCIFLFAPWALIFGKDRFDKAATREPEFSIPIQLPVEHTYRPNVSAFWGILLLIVSIAILSISFFAASKIFQAGQLQVVMAVVVGMIGLIVSSGFAFGAVNMLFAYRKVKLTSSTVDVYEKAFLIVIPKIRQWSSLLSNYSNVVAEEKVIQAASDTNANYFVVSLLHISDAKKNIELYRAYHSDDYKKVAASWKKILNFK